MTREKRAAICENPGIEAELQQITNAPMPERTLQPVLFEGLFDKPVQVAFDSEALTSDAGLMLFAAADKRLGVTDALASQIRDSRQSGKVQHEMEDLLKQRIYGIAAGYEDCNDSARISSGPALKLACGRSPLLGEDLGSQPTLSRFENQLTGERRQLRTEFAARRGKVTAGTALA